MTQPKLRDQKANERLQANANRVSTREIAKEAVRGGPKTEKKDKRPTSGGRRG